MEPAVGPVAVAQAILDAEERFAARKELVPGSGQPEAVARMDAVLPFADAVRQFAGAWRRMAFQRFEY
jgi:hypothetical protein